MKEYFQWVAENCARVWDIPEEEVKELLLTGKKAIPEAFSIQIYITEVLKK